MIHNDNTSKVAAVICEYNPFHAGHAYHLAQTRSLGATHIVAIMSGSFVQRGEPALFSPKTTDFRRKWFPLDKSLLQV